MVFSTFHMSYKYQPTTVISIFKEVEVNSLSPSSCKALKAISQLMQKPYWIVVVLDL